MCISLYFHYTECDHRCRPIRPCQGDGSCCDNFVVETRLFIINSFCYECFMLPDPRVAQPVRCLRYQSEESMLDWMAECYRSWDVEAEFQDLRIRAPNLPRLPGHLHNPNFPLSNRIPVGLVPRESVILLVRDLYHRVLPDFWLRVIWGENPSPAKREWILYLEIVLAINAALPVLRDSISENLWEAGMGQQRTSFIAAEAFDPVALTLVDDEDCGLCREPLRDVEEQGVPVKTHCDHMFHQKCLEEYLEVSRNVDCPACRAELRGQNPATQDIQGRDQISEFLTSVMTPEQQTFPPEQPITEQYIQQLNADVEGNTDDRVAVEAQQEQQKVAELEESLNDPDDCELATMDNLSI
ncbi:ce60a0d1-3048-4334-a04f-caca67ab41c5-CDS [Sclerotinia trifoliorum]|uniref:Ce60a0d1-3048-4334-a04f-caca67ab41c5-CDS n=1 Tax=Sclerotinia trifoliorum TaxID=28548 RepID=A0A8H2ZQ47_9HELO|nr:ce60a0d1-3048-4334-a04f-caca67ab41c5-CDS [Sclerotinia trifoliorum]